MSVFDDEVLTIDELANYLKLKRQTIYRWAQKGKLPGAKIGKEWRFRKSLISEWLEKNLGAPQGKAPAASAAATNGDSPRPEAPTHDSRVPERESRKSPKARKKKAGTEKN